MSRAVYKMSLTEQFKEELGMLKKAPLTFIVGFVVLAVLIYWAEYSFIFKEWIARKDNLIETLQKQLTTAKDQPQSRQSAPASPQTTPSTGDATSSGNNSPANTGNGNTFTNTERPLKQKPKEHRE